MHVRYVCMYECVNRVLLCFEFVSFEGELAHAVVELLVLARAQVPLARHDAGDAAAALCKLLGGTAAKAERDAPAHRRREPLACGGRRRARGMPPHAFCEALHVPRALWERLAHTDRRRHPLVRRPLTHTCLPVSSPVLRRSHACWGREQTNRRLR